MRVPLLFWLIDMLCPRHIAVVGKAARPAFLSPVTPLGVSIFPPECSARLSLPPDELKGLGQSRFFTTMLSSPKRPSSPTTESGS
jgi:hypothetical protein